MMGSDVSNPFGRRTGHGLSALILPDFSAKRNRYPADFGKNFSVPEKNP
jgi:hypothetical protein